MNKSVYLTSTLPYANSRYAHMGHTFEFVLADVLSRYFRNKLGKENVLFNTGLDENGLNIWNKSQELELTHEQYLNEVTFEWEKFCELFHIKYDNFYKTSSFEHHEKVKKIWDDFFEKGDIYKKKYTGLYCCGCESFKVEKEIVDNKCPDHTNLELKIIDEENWFFKLTKYKEELKIWINNNPNFLSPQSKIDELKNLINDSEDISISRLKINVKLGVEVPNDPEQIIYIWMEALQCYLISCGYKQNEEKFNKFWNGTTIQICGPDNLRFQAVIFQSFLASAGIKKTDKLLVHGTILDEEGRKMSKTMGNVIDPIEQLNKFGVDAVRYYLTFGLNTFSNSKYSESDLINLWNSEVVNGLGNVISRTLHLVDIRGINPNEENLLIHFKNKLKNQFELISLEFESFNFQEAKTNLNNIIFNLNKRFETDRPFDKECINCEQIITEIYYELKNIIPFYKLILTSHSDSIDKAFVDNKKVILFKRL